MDFYFCDSGRSNLSFFYLAHILCSCTRQYECDDVLDGFWGPGDGCQSDHGWIQVAKQCQDKFSRVLIFVVQGSFANIEKITLAFLHKDYLLVGGERIHTVQPRPVSTSPDLPPSHTADGQYRT